MANLSLLDLFTLQRNDPLTGLVDDVTTAAPEFDVFSAVPRSGTFYEVVRRVALPSIGFRNINAGTATNKSTYKKEVKQMFLLDGLINVDESILKADDASAGDVWSLEAAGILRAAMIVLGAQTYYGTSADAKGFVGLRSQIAGSVVAGGTTNSTTAYLVNMDPKIGVRFDVGRDGAINMPPPMRQQLPDPNDSTKSLFYWVSNLSCFIGLNVISDKAVWGVTGIAAHQTSNVNDQGMTDYLASTLVANIPASRRPGLRWFMNRTAYATLRQSRTTINVASGYSTQPVKADGTGGWAPAPESCEGYPITVTDSLTNTESN